MTVMRHYTLRFKLHDYRFVCTQEMNKEAADMLTSALATLNGVTDIRRYPEDKEDASCTTSPT